MYSWFDLNTFSRQTLTHLAIFKNSKRGIRVVHLFLTAPESVGLRNKTARDGSESVASRHRVQKSCSPVACSDNHHCQNT